MILFPVGPKYWHDWDQKWSRYCKCHLGANNRCDKNVPYLVSDRVIHGLQCPCFTSPVMVQITCRRDMTSASIQQMLHLGCIIQWFSSLDLPQESWEVSQNKRRSKLLQLREILSTVYPKKYAHGFVVLCFVVVMQLFIMNSHEVFIHIHQRCFAGTGAIVRLPQCQWSKPDGYGKISQCITTTKHSKAKTVCIFLGIYCTCTTSIKSQGSRLLLH